MRSRVAGLTFHVVVHKIDNPRQRPTQSWDITPEWVVGPWSLKYPLPNGEFFR